MNEKDLYDNGWVKWSSMKKFGPMSRHARRLCWRILKNLDFASMLDAGCGEGSFLKYVATMRRNVKLTGVDISSTAIDEARRSFQAADFFIFDIERSGVEGLYDLVTAIDVIEHIKDDESFLRNLRKVTKKYLLICTLIGRMRPFEKHVGHFRNYTEEGLSDKIKNAGFEVLNIKKWGFPFYSPMYRDILDHTPEKVSTGKFGFFKKLLSRAIYLLFFLNSDNRGDVIIVLARPK